MRLSCAGKKSIQECRKKSVWLLSWITFLNGFIHGIINGQKTEIWTILKAVSWLMQFCGLHTFLYEFEQSRNLYYYIAELQLPGFVLIAMMAGIAVSFKGEPLLSQFFQCCPEDEAHWWYLQNPSLSSVTHQHITVNGCLFFPSNLFSILSSVIIQPVGHSKSSLFGQKSSMAVWMQEFPKRDELVSLSQHVRL